jgi:hypothetical protein
VFIQTIIHELAQHVGTATGPDEIGDPGGGQVDDPQMRALTPHDRTHNAESYGNFAFEANFGRQPI